jgi:2,3-dihydroxybiphenyl 1,2-dioxygenase
MSNIAALGYVGLGVSDLPAWRRFATGILGLQAVANADGGLDLRMDAYAARLRLTGDAADDLLYAGWEVRDRQALEDLGSRLAAHGTTVMPGTGAEAAARGVRELIRCVDPEGLSLEIYYGPLQKTNDPFVSPLGVSFKTGSQGLGHIVLVAKDPAAQERFYVDVLGFRISDYIQTEVVPGRPLRITFMRCNGRHHSLALAALPLKKKLQHLMLEVRSLDDVGRALYRCQDAGQHISLTLGRHSNDDMLSFYPLTPSGFDLEYGWAGLEVDDERWHVMTHDTNSAWGHRFQRPPRPPQAAKDS